MIQNLHRLFGGKIYPKGTWRKDGANRRAVFSWELWGAQAETFLRTTRPYIVSKTEQVDIALGFIESSHNFGSKNSVRYSDSEFQARRKMFEDIRWLKTAEASLREVPS
jgi:hypothetical protein